MGVARGVASGLSSIPGGSRRVSELAAKYGLDPSTPDGAAQIWRAHVAEKTGIKDATLFGEPTEYVPPAKAARAAEEAPSLGARLSKNQDLAQQIDANAANMDPALLARIKQGDEDAFIQAYQDLAASEGVLPQRPFRQMELPLTGDTPQNARDFLLGRLSGPGVRVGGVVSPSDVRSAHGALRDSWPVPYDADADEVMGAISQFSPEQQRYLKALHANDWLGFDYPSQAASAGLVSPSGFDLGPDLVSARQGLLGARAGDADVRQLIAETRGGLVPAGPRGMSRLDPDRIDAEFVPDAEFIPNPEQRGLAAVSDGGEIMVVPGRRGLVPADRTPLTGEVEPRQFDPRRPARNETVVDGRPTSKLKKAAAAAAATLAIGEGVRQFVNDSEQPGVTSTGGTAELRSEQKPVPEVSAPAEPTAEMYFAQARELIDRLNLMRREAGGEVPEAPQIMARVKKLQAMGDQLRNSPTYKMSDSGDPSQQAQMLIQDLNARRKKAGGEVPDAAKVMAEVRRLQAMGDQQKNSRYGRSGSYSQAYPRSA